MKTSLLLSGLLLALSIPTTWTQAQAPGAHDPGSSTEGEARGLYLAGAAAFEGGRFREALRHFQRAYELSQRPELLYNIASAADRAREDALALESYEAFLARSPETPLRDRVEARISELRELRDGPPPREPSDAPDATSGAEDEAPRARRERDIDGRKVLSLSLLSAGAATVVAGGVVLGLGLGDKSSVQDPVEGARWDEDAAALRDRGERRLTAGAVLLPIGVAAAAVGTFLTIKNGGKKKDGVEVQVGPTGFSLRGRF